MRSYQQAERGEARTVEDTGDLAEERTDPLSASGHLNIEELLDGHGVAEFVRHCDMLA